MLWCLKIAIFYKTYIWPALVETLVGARIGFSRAANGVIVRLLLVSKVGFGRLFYSANLPMAEGLAALVRCVLAVSAFLVSLKLAVDNDSTAC